MKKLPSRHRRLDAALADLPLDEPMLLSELDGFLTGVLLCPEPIPAAEWLDCVWGVSADGSAAFEDPADVAWFVDSVMARRTEITRDMVRGKLQPILDVDERNGDVIWEPWIDGFEAAMALRPAVWEAVRGGGDPSAVAALAGIATLIAVANDESAFDSIEINAMQARIPLQLADHVLALHAARPRDAAVPVAQASVASARVGRNDPCPCGSGKKSKRCCA